MNPFLTTGTRYYRVLVLGPVIDRVWDCPGSVIDRVWGLSWTRVPDCLGPV